MTKTIFVARKFAKKGKYRDGLKFYVKASQIHFYEKSTNVQALNR